MTLIFIYASISLSKLEISFFSDRYNYFAPSYSGVNLIALLKTNGGGVSEMIQDGVSEEEKLILHNFLNKFPRENKEEEGYWSLNYGLNNKDIVISKTNKLSMELSDTYYYGAYHVSDISQIHIPNKLVLKFYCLGECD
jgi:hypothetical protein